MLVEELLKYFLTGGAADKLVDQNWWPEDRQAPEKPKPQGTRPSGFGGSGGVSPGSGLGGTNRLVNPFPPVSDWNIISRGGAGGAGAGRAPAPMPSTLPPVPPYLNPFLHNPGNTMSEGWVPPAQNKRSGGLGGSGGFGFNNLQVPR